MLRRKTDQGNQGWDTSIVQISSTMTDRSMICVIDVQDDSALAMLCLKANSNCSKDCSRHLHCIKNLKIPILMNNFFDYLPAHSTVILNIKSSWNRAVAAQKTREVCERWDCIFFETPARSPVGKKLILESRVDQIKVTLRAKAKKLYND